MKHVLIGWELGAGRGHIDQVMRLTDDLQALGCRVTLALQRVDLAPRRAGLAVWQAPIWPHMLSAYPATRGPTATMGDIVAQLGLIEPGAFATLIGSWDAILAATNPDLVISEYAPALLCAAAGRLPRVAVGTGFERVPSHLARFPILIGDKAHYDEARILAFINAQLVALDRAALASLPGLFEAEHDVVSTFAEIDPYAAVRMSGYCPPETRHRGDWPDAEGEEVFVYGNEVTRNSRQFWVGLVTTGLKIRAFQKGLTTRQAASLQSAGVIIEPSPLSADVIARRSRLVVSHGGHGFVCSAMLSGLPQVVLCTNLETRLHGKALQSHGLGQVRKLADVNQDEVRSLVLQAYEDRALADRVRRAAPEFRARMRPSQSATLAAIMAE